MGIEDGRAPALRRAATGRAASRPGPAGSALAGVVGALLLAGCAGVVPGAEAPALSGRPSQPFAGAAAPGELAAVTRSLAGATEVEPVVVSLPPLASWPRYLRAAGPLYGLVQFSPYVGQFGVLADARRADAGMGYGAVVGYRRPLSGTNVLGFELIYEASGHRNEASAVDASATRLIAGVRASFRMDERVVPFAVGGLGSYSLEFDGLDPRFNLSGLGVMLGGGVNISRGPKISLRTEMALHLWDAAEESGSGGLAETLTLAVGAAFSF